jgi:hypothetical protein
MPRIVAILALWILTTPLSAQVVSFDSSAWKIEAAAHQILQYRGQQALYIKGGSAELDAPPFKNGEIEFDVAFSAERTFGGAQWRVVDDSNGEIFYFRPHQSGNADANQYTPVDNGLTGWQLYHGPQYATPTRYRFNEYQHTRIVFKDGLADIYIDSDEPVLTVEHKRESTAGTIAVYSSGLAPMYFSNFQYRASDDVEIVGTPVELEAAAPGTVTAWTVSNAFSEEVLDGATEIPQDLVDQSTWTDLESEVTGITNLATIAQISDSTNTVLAKVTVKSESDQTEIVKFGYSDRVRVFLNGKLLYSGNNGFVTRDYRYLGTIGLFDEVPLMLNKGDNELVFAVSESFGGWGLLAQFSNPDAVTVTGTQ